MFDFGIKDIIDIFLVALMLYYIYRLMRESRSLNVFIGIMLFIIIWLFVSQILEMRLLGSIMDKLVSVGVIAIIILFQEEIRKFFYNIGARQRFRTLTGFFHRDRKTDDEADKRTIMPIVLACMNMARHKVGALIVLERESTLTDVITTGDLIDVARPKRFSFRKAIIFLAVFSSVVTMFWMLPPSAVSTASSYFLEVWIRSATTPRMPGTRSFCSITRRIEPPYPS